MTTEYGSAFDPFAPAPGDDEWLRDHGYDDTEPEVDDEPFTHPDLDNEAARAAWIAAAEEWVNTQCLPSERVPAGHPARAWDKDDAETVDLLGPVLVKGVRPQVNAAITAARKASNVAAAQRAEQWRKQLGQVERGPKYGTPTADRWLQIARMVDDASRAWLKLDGLAQEQRTALDELLRIDGERKAALDQAAGDLLAEAIDAEKARRSAAGAWAEELQRREQYAEADDDPEPEPGAEPPMYAVVEGCLTWNKRTANGTEPVTLATFDAKIAEEVTVDDGTERRLLWDLYVKAQDGGTGNVKIPPEHLGRPQQWATKAVGMSALVMPGLAVADHVRVAVQSRSRSAQRRTVYAHTGWRHLGGRWVYLSASGALSASGLDDTVSVELESLSGFAFPELRELRGFREQTRASLALLRIASDIVMVPLLASAYRAVLPLSPDCSVWLFGRSGTFKTAITSLTQQHFGPSMGPQNLPGNWTSTANALEGQAHVLANALFVVDDYSPDATEADARRRATAADRLMRGAANQAGRGRLRPDGTLRPDKPPRAQILTSAEDVPPSIGSLRARVMVDEISPGSVDVTALSEAQKQATAGTFAQAMAGFVQWLATKYDADPGLPAALATQRDEYRDLAQAAGQHPRVPLNIASLALGWRQFLTYAADTGAISEEEAAEYWNRAWKALAETGAAQERYRRDADPMSRYLGAISALIASRRAYLAAPDNTPPGPKPERWGWTFDVVRAAYAPAPGALLIGWTDGGEDGDLYLHPDTVYNAAKRFAEDGGAPLGVSKRAIHNDLKTRGLLASTSAPDRHTQKKNVGGKQRDVLHLPQRALDRSGEL